MRKTKMEKGITLVALIITIVVLLILAVVAINSITNEGILGKSESAANKYNQSVKDEQKVLDGYLEQLEGSAKIVDENGNDVRNQVLSTTKNTEVYDKYGNKIVVPAGFKIVVDGTTNNADTVTKGIVIEDCTGTATNGSQFVWIPVGTIYTDTERTEANAKTITLGRYSFDSNGVPRAYSGSNTEDTAANHNSDYGNAIARDIEAFITSATTKGGYYIGRYEARTNNTTERTSSSDAVTAVTSVKTNAVYNYVTQPQASSLAQGMYADGYKTDGTGTFSSDLINSYAWDTAIVFLQTFDNRVDKTKPYSSQNSLNKSFSLTGTTEDVICNVYDMASNCWEWTTESTSYSGAPCVQRGGDCGSYYSTGFRYFSTDSYSDTLYAFRPLLYVGL